MVATKEKKTASSVANIRALAAAVVEASKVRERVDEYGRPVVPDASLFEALDRLQESYDPTAIPYARRAMAALVKVREEIRATEVLGEGLTYVPTSLLWMRFWNRVDEAISAINAEPPKRKRRKTPSELKAEGVSLRQIAYEWRWFAPDGSPDEEAVEAELANPGSVLTPEAIQARLDFDLICEGWKLSPDELAALQG